MGIAAAVRTIALATSVEWTDAVCGCDVDFSRIRSNWAAVPVCLASPSCCAAFTHVEPWLNPEDLADLWYFDGPPDEHGKLNRIFSAVPHRVMFAGHFHKWLLATPDGIRDWQGRTPIRLNEGRYFVVVGPLCEGHFAIFETPTSELTPFNNE